MIFPSNFSLAIILLSNLKPDRKGKSGANLFLVLRFGGDQSLSNSAHPCLGGQEKTDYTHCPVLFQILRCQPFELVQIRKPKLRMLILLLFKKITVTILQV